MFDVGGGELLFIVLIILLLFGPKKIPELMRSVGSGLRHFRRAQEDLTRQIRDLSTQDPTQSPPQADRGVASDVPVVGNIDDGPDASVATIADDVPDAMTDEPANEAPPLQVTPTPAPGAQPRHRPNDTPKESPQV